MDNAQTQSMNWNFNSHIFYWEEWKHIKNLLFQEKLKVVRQWITNYFLKCFCIEKIRTYNKTHQLKHSICRKLQCFSLHVHFSISVTAIPLVNVHISTFKKHSTKVTMMFGACTTKGYMQVDVSIPSQHYILIPKVGEQWRGLVQLNGTCKIYNFFSIRREHVFFYNENRNWIHAQISFFLFWFVWGKRKEKKWVTWYSRGYTFPMPKIFLWSILIHTWTLWT